MLNSKAKFLMFFCLLGCFGTTQPFLQSLSQTYYTKLYGNEDADQKYVKLARSFLKNLGVKNADQVPIKQFSQKGLKNENVSSITLARTIPPAGIWLCEQRLEQFPEAVAIFTLAHETAHYIETLWQELTLSQKIREKNADLKAAQLLCEHNYAWVVSKFIEYLKQKVAAGANFVDSTHPTHQEQLAYLQEFYTSWQKQHAKSSGKTT